MNTCQKCGNPTRGTSICNECLLSSQVSSGDYTWVQITKEQYRELIGEEYVPLDRLSEIGDLLLVSSDRAELIRKWQESLTHFDLAWQQFLLEKEEAEREYKELTKAGGNYSGLK